MEDSTRLFVWVVAFLILLAAQGVTAGLTWMEVPLVCVNAFVVALAAMGGYEATFGRGEKVDELE